MLIMHCIQPSLSLIVPVMQWLCHEIVARVYAHCASNCSSQLVYAHANHVTNFNPQQSMNHTSLKKKKIPICKVTHALAVQDMFWPIYMPDLIMHASPFLCTFWWNCDCWL